MGFTNLITSDFCTRLHNCSDSDIYVFDTEINIISSYNQPPVRVLFNICKLKSKNGFCSDKFILNKAAL